jgi:hypothetical protein
VVTLPPGPVASGRRRRASRRRRTAWWGLLALVLAGPGTTAVATPAVAAPDRVVPTYVPAGFVDSTRTAAQVDGDLADLARFGVNRALANLVALGPTGTLKLSATTSAMLPLWASRAAVHDAATGDRLAVVAVLNAKLTKGLDVADPATRAAVVADARRVAAMGVGGVQLDFEPFPTSPGFVTLLGDVRAALATSSPGTSLSVVAPGGTATWSAAHLGAVSAQVDEVDPTFYDSGIHNVADYERWVEAGLAVYSSATAPSARIVPILPSYRSNPWHRPAVENIATATTAVGVAVAAGDRVDGAGIWWWWGFFFGAGGHYQPAADQAAWQSVTRPLLGF